MSQAFDQNFKLGVLGGGQLGRMLIQQAINLNLHVNILDPDPNAPCKDIATEFQVGSLKDFDTVYQFGKNCDVVTIEIEHVNTEALKKLQSEGIKVFPQPEVIELIQDKRTQKQFYLQNQIPTAEFVLTENRQDLQQLIEKLPAVHKLGREGYDGRGVQIIRSAQDIERGFDAPGLLEQLVDFEKEISVIVARNEDGQMQTFPAVELVYHPEQNMVDYLMAPADISEEIRLKAEQVAKEVIQKLDMIGLLAVEMFVTKDQQVLVNEVAPRTHNSGHQTIEDNYTSQFEQHLRAILNLPLGSTISRTPSAMVNLLGEDGYTGAAIYTGIEKVMALEGVYIHLYGKKITKPFRKMGHVTIIGPNKESLKQKIAFIKENLKIIA
jgi:5-(carboxyamino)imidazole ribonucleotide synthase